MPSEILRRLRKNCTIPSISVRHPREARPMPKSAEALRDPTFTEDPATSAPARSTTSPIEMRVTPVLTHERRVRSLARWSRTSLSLSGRRAVSVVCPELKTFDLPPRSFSEVASSATVRRLTPNRGLYKGQR